ncbi:hypothetical protein AUP68_06597 [Ilyonectria robusta]
MASQGSSGSKAEAPSRPVPTVYHRRASQRRRRCRTYAPLPAAIASEKKHHCARADDCLPVASRNWKTARETGDKMAVLMCTLVFFGSTATGKARPNAMSLFDGSRVEEDVDK